MGYWARAIAVLGAVMMLSPSLAAAQELEQSRALLRLIGFDVAARQVEAEFQHPPDRFPGEMQAAWRVAAEGRFRAEEIFETAAVRMDGKLDADEIAALEDYLSDGLGARVTALEAAAQDPDNAARVEAEKQAYLDGLGSGFMERFELIKDCAQALQMVETSVAMVLNVSYSISSGMMASGQLPGLTSEEDILEALAMQEPKIRSVVEQNVISSLAYTYRELTDAELRAYAEFLQTEPARAIYSVMDRAIEEVVRRDSRALGRDLIELSTQERL